MLCQRKKNHEVVEKCFGSANACMTLYGCMRLCILYIFEKGPKWLTGEETIAGAYSMCQLISNSVLHTPANLYSGAI